MWYTIVIVHLLIPFPSIGFFSINLGLPLKVLSFLSSRQSRIFYTHEFSFSVLGLFFLFLIRNLTPFFSLSRMQSLLSLFFFSVSLPLNTTYLREIDRSCHFKTVVYTVVLRRLFNYTLRNYYKDGLDLPSVSERDRALRNQIGPHKTLKKTEVNMTNQSLSVSKTYLELLSCSIIFQWMSTYGKKESRIFRKPTTKHSFIPLRQQEFCYSYT